MQTPLPNNSFDAVVRRQRKGEFLSDVSEALTKAVMAVKEHAKTTAFRI